MIVSVLDQSPPKETDSEEEKLAHRLSQWGTGCIEELKFYSHVLRVVDMRSHLIVYEYINKRGMKIGEFDKNDKLWRYKAVAAVFGCTEADANKLPENEAERQMFLTLVKNRITKLIGTEDEEEKKLLGLLVMRRMLV